VESNPSSSGIRSLLSIWESVLGLSSIDVEDDFFELGGDPASAVRLFDEIAKVWGRELPPLMIYKSPTVRALAALLNDPAPPRFPPVVRLKAGSQAPPAFVTHGLGSSVMELFEVIGHIQTEHPIYGMQAKGSDGSEEPLARIEDMAQFFLGEVRRWQPRGPYLLIGYSLGGLVVLEMAQRLLRSGERIALLVMLDSYPHRRQLSFIERLRLSSREAKRSKPAGSGFQTSPPSTANIGCVQSLRAANGMSASVAQRMRDCSYLALQRYRPRFYQGKIKYVRAEVPTEFPVDPAVVWEHRARTLEVETVPGDHHGMLTSHARSLAKVLSRYLESASDLE
jgi:aspartate racemase